MNKYLLQWLTAKIAEKLPEDQADKAAVFAENFFSTITYGLRTDSIVQINNFGVFTLDNGTITFMPDSAFADSVNLPFAYFEPIPVEDDSLADSLSVIEPQQKDITGNAIPMATVKEPASELGTNDNESTEEQADQAAETVPDKEDPHKIPDEPKEDADEEPQEYEQEETQLYEPGSRFPWFWLILVFIFGGGIGYIIGTNYPYYERWVPERETLENETIDTEYPDNDSTETETSTPVQNSIEDLSDTAATSAETVKPQAVPDARQKIVYDTVSSRRYLTTMSRRHYGSPEFWPYIYLENRANLGHPDRIPPATVVVIPPASKYGIDSNNPESIAAAKREGVKIYEQFKKK